jgi:hypothetical protein
MSKGQSGHKGINWKGIILALLLLTGSRLVLAVIRGDLKQERSGGILTADELDLDLSSLPVQIDLLRDGRIIVDGKVKNADEFDILIAEWIKEKRLLSIYSEPRAGDGAPQVKAASDAMINARLPFSPRMKPQKVRVSDATDDGSHPNLQQ